MINILIRTSNRPSLFKRCIESINRQSYKEIKVIVSVDNDRASEYAVAELEDCYFQKEIIRVKPQPAGEYYYNLYCNDLVNRVQDGWFFFLDDDDYLYGDKALETISRHFQGETVIICQFLRNDRPKPSNGLMDRKEIRLGRIGLPCAVVYSNLKKANFRATEDADYRWIKQYESFNPKFVKEVLVVTDRRSKGKPE